MEKKSRRNFIKKSTLLGIGFFIVPRNVLGGVGYTPPSDQLKKNKERVIKFSRQKVMTMKPLEKNN